MRRKRAVRFVLGIALAVSSLAMLGDAFIELIAPLEYGSLKKEIKAERDDPEGIAEGSRVQGAALAKAIVALFGGFGSAPLWMRTLKRRSIATKPKVILTLIAFPLAAVLFPALDFLVTRMIRGLIG